MIQEKFTIPLDVNTQYDISGPYPDFAEVGIEIKGNDVYVFQDDDIICMSIHQAKQLTNYLHDTIVRPVRFDYDIGDDHD